MRQLASMMRNKMLKYASTREETLLYSFLPCCVCLAELDEEKEEPSGGGSSAADNLTECLDVESLLESRDLATVFALARADRHESRAGESLTMRSLLESRGCL